MRLVNVSAWRLTDEPTNMAIVKSVKREGPLVHISIISCQGEHKFELERRELMKMMAEAGVLADSPLLPEPPKPEAGETASGYLSGDENGRPS